jgi:dTDP-glucose 4,6-dehydratase
VLERGETGNVYNISGETPQTNLELTRTLTQRCGKSMETHVNHVADRPGHDRRYAVNSAKLQALGWRPRVPFDKGIAHTIDWYRNNQSWWRPLREAHAQT